MLVFALILRVDGNAQVISAHSKNAEGTDSVTAPKPKGDLPEPSGYINDFTCLFSLDELRYLDSLVRFYEARTTNEIVVVTLDSSFAGDNEFDCCALLLANKWGVGKKDKSNGILIALSGDLHRIRIENGQGITQFLSDSETKAIIETISLPFFERNEYFEGIKQTILALISKLDRRN
jgi:uncharacterized protein